MDLLADEAIQMKAAWNAPGYMMQHDEVRTLNWDVSCQERISMRALYSLPMARHAASF